ncbi:MAG: hypothetical protein ACKVQS_06185 [Fimbriimonadaceae bacterium]
MRFWQVGAIGALAFILGCGGMGAYVPDGATGTGTPLQCSTLSLIVPNTVDIDQGTVDSVAIVVVNGQISQFLTQGRAPGDATVTLSVSGLPNFVTGSFSPNPVTVGLNAAQQSDLTLDATGSQAGSSYNVTVTATEAGCTPVSETFSLNVFSGG